MAIQSTHTVRVMPRASAAESVFADVPEYLTGELRVGVTAGQWSVIDVIRAMIEVWGPGFSITVMSWRMSRIDVKELYGMVRLGKFTQARLVVSHQMRGTERNEFEAVAELAGDNLRVCRSHMKGFVAMGTWGTIAYLTSANFNRNPRNESYELHLGGTVASAYDALTERLFAMQKPRAWERDRAAGTKLYKKTMVELRLATPITMGESRTEKARRRAAAGNVDSLDDTDDHVTLAKALDACRRVAGSKLNRKIQRAVVPSISALEVRSGDDVRYSEVRKTVRAPGARKNAPTDAGNDIGGGEGGGTISSAS